VLDSVWIDEAALHPQHHSGIVKALMACLGQLQAHASRVISI